MARLAVRVALVHREADVVFRARSECAVSRECARRCTWLRGWEERISALGAEEVLLVVRPLPQLGIVERDEALVDDRRLAMVALGCELLEDKSFG